MQMTDAPAAKRARVHALDASVATVVIPGLGVLRHIFVLGDGTRLVSTEDHTIVAVSRWGSNALIAGSKGIAAMKDGERASACFNYPIGLTVDRGGNIVVMDTRNHAIRMVSRAGHVSTLAGMQIDTY